MRRIIDCAVIVFLDYEKNIQKWMSNVVSMHTKLRIHPIYFSIQNEQRPEILINMEMLLKRYDVCILPIASHSLAWARMALACAKPQLKTPIVGLTYKLKPAAINDLLELGLDNFIVETATLNEVFPRIIQSLVRPLSGSEHTSLEADEFDSQDFLVRGYHTQSFKKAKEHVVQEFERSYISHTLNECRGNISQAAKIAHKNRRAYWELIRKHQIDPEKFKYTD